MQDIRLFKNNVICKPSEKSRTIALVTNKWCPRKWIETPKGKDKEGQFIMFKMSFIIAEKQFLVA